MKRQRGKYPRDLHRENIQAKKVNWRDCGTDYGDLDNNSSNSAYKHSLQLSLTNCLLSNKLAQYIWTCHCVKFATLTLQTNETESIRQCMQMQRQKTYSNQATCRRTQQLLPLLRQKCCVLLCPCCSGGYNNSLQHATRCANRRNMQHSTMLRPFARGFKSVASGQ